MDRKPRIRTVGARSSPAQLRAHRRLERLFEQHRLRTPELFTNLGLFLRSPILAKILYLDELYRRIHRLPGVIMEFGCWYGANLCVFQALRSVYEPYNYTRKVIGFDTFAGYSRPAGQDRAPRFAKGYVLQEADRRYLLEVLKAHEDENVMPHLRRFAVVKGDVSVTVPEFFRRRPQTLVALAYLDLGLYEPTRVVLERLRPHLVPGSVIAMDQLNSDELPGETLAFREALRGIKCRVQRSRFLPDRTIVTVQDVRGVGR